MSSFRKCWLPCRPRRRIVRQRRLLLVPARSIHSTFEKLDINELQRSGLQLVLNLKPGLSPDKKFLLSPSFNADSKEGCLGLAVEGSFIF